MEKPVLSFKDNLGKSKRVLLSKNDLKYIDERINKLANSTNDIGPCPRANVELAVEGKKPFIRQACLNSGSVLAKELMSMTELFTGIL